MNANENKHKKLKQIWVPTRLLEAGKAKGAITVINESQCARQYNVQQQQQRQQQYTPNPIQKYPRFKKSPKRIWGKVQK